MTVGIVVFPGSNCDRDCEHVFQDVLGVPTRLIWHKESTVGDVEAVILPGGFSYGDYLRAGSLAKVSPIMDAVKRFARAGGLVLGICNGFQILLEAGLLPGAMLRNRHLTFICEDVYVRVENAATPFTRQCTPGDVLKLPIAHADGNYYADPVTLSAIKAQAQIVFRYCDRDGQTTPDANPNGSLDNIAGLCNAEGNVLGVMPHPERCAESLLHNTDGLRILSSMIGVLRGEVVS